MGGESSKQSGSSGATRSRERKRSGLSNALAGGDCRSTSVNQRPSPSGPVYGDIPERIPAGPVKCAAVPVAKGRGLDRALTWIPDTEASLMTEWNRERQAAAAAGARGQTRGSGDGPDSAADGQALGSKQISATAADQATAGVTSSNSSTCCGVPLHCDFAPAATGRSTGVTFRVPTTWTQTGGGSPSQSSSTPSSPQAPADRRGGSSVVIAALPVGIEYYRALQARWATPESCALPPATEEEDLNDSIILEAVADPDGSVLSPPVPLGYMIDLFVPQWRAEGLYEQAELSNQQR